MKTRLGSLAVLAVCLVPQSAAAWGSVEHSAIARSAHALACRTLKGFATAPDETRLAEVCPDEISLVDTNACAGLPPPESPRMPIRPYRPHADDFASRISDGAALAGDYLRAPDDFDSVTAQRALSTVYAYLFLANDNDDHFHPRVVTLMLRHLTAARELATQAHGAGTASHRHELVHAAINQLVFSLHFAQDAFAAGHMGFNRAGSSAGPSQRLHAVYNTLGREVINYQGSKFVVFGDSHYCKMTADARFMVVATSASILLEVLGRYVLDDDRATAMLTALDVDAIRFVPASAMMAQALVYSNRLELLPPKIADKPQVSYNFPPVSAPLATVSGTARQSVSLGAGMVLPIASNLMLGLSGAYMAGRKHERPIDLGFTGGAFGSPSKRYRVEGGGVARVGFIGSGLLTIEPCLLLAFDGGLPASQQHRQYVSPRLQVLLELGQLAFLRVGAGYEFGFDLSRPAYDGVASGIVVAANLGILIGAFGGGPLDLGNISRGF